MRAPRGLFAVLTLLPGLVGSAAGAEVPEVPIVDTHVHYSLDAWTIYSPERALEILAAAGVRRAFVSSTPDEGTLRLHRLAPDRVVPVLRPYRQGGELGSWHLDPTVVPYLEERLRSGIYRGIGEFHLSGDQARSPVVERVAELAARHGIFLHCHCDVHAAEILLGLRPDVRVLWAHAGMSAGPDVVGGLLDRSPRLSVELALRGDVAPGGALDPGWQAVFLRYPDRFMVGTDTWVAPRWEEIAAVQEQTRRWLRQLPPDVARRLAGDNADRLARPSP